MLLNETFLRVQFLNFQSYALPVLFNQQLAKHKRFEDHLSSGKGPTQELYSSSRRTAVLPLFKNYMKFFFGYFSGLGNVASPIMVSLEHPTFRLRGGDVTTSPPLPLVFRRVECGGDAQD